MEQEEMKQVNVQMPADLQEMLDEMVKADESDRSKFIRLLIRKEHARRADLPPTKKNNARPVAVAA